MQTLTNRAKQVDRRPMTLMEKMYLPSIFKGMGITFSHLFKKKPTINYPEQKRPFSAVFRGLHILNRDEEGRERCTACGLCALACPAEAITMEAAERSISTAKKNMPPSMRLTCCVAFFAAFVRKLARKMRFIYLKLLRQPIMAARVLFTVKKTC